MCDVLKVCYAVKGAHVHCRVFHNGLAGTLVFAEQEWPLVQRWLHMISEVVPEESERGAGGSTSGSQPGDAGSSPAVRSSSYRV